MKNTEKLQISEGAKIAAKWWTDRLDGTIKPFKAVIDDAPTIIEEAEEFKNYADENNDEMLKQIANALYNVTKKMEGMDLHSDADDYISKEESEKLRRNLEILLQTSINSLGREWLATDEDRACGYLGLACYLAGIDHENLVSLPLNVMMHVSADKVEIEYKDFAKNEVVFDAAKEAHLKETKVLPKQNSGRSL